MKEKIKALWQTHVAENSIPAVRIVAHMLLGMVIALVGVAALILACYTVYAIGVSWNMLADYLFPMVEGSSNLVRLGNILVFMGGILVTIVGGWLGVMLAMDAEKELEQKKAQMMKDMLRTSSLDRLY